LLRLMASFVDSELAGSAGFADTINDAPGIKSRIAAAGSCWKRPTMPSACST
jgi:ring-1,2-phenylacetyl-CoA epoxidase subunit PaaA